MKYAPQPKRPRVKCITSIRCMAHGSMLLGLNTLLQVPNAPPPSYIPLIIKELTPPLCAPNGIVIMLIRVTTS
jgi:hypothetical protein